ncbi:YjcZ family sporulation protein [Brevibacillus sp. TJ4]
MQYSGEGVRIMGFFDDNFALILVLFVLLAIVACTVD